MKKYFLILLVVISCPLVGFAAGIQVTPEKLEFETGSGVLSKTIVVANPTADVQVYEVYPDSFERSIGANPQSFTLEAGGRRKVEITVDPQKLDGMTSTNLSVVARPLASGSVQVNTGVKIPLTVKASGRPQKVPMAIGAAVLVSFAAAGYSFLRMRKRRTAKP